MNIILTTEFTKSAIVWLSVHFLKLGAQVEPLNTPQKISTNIAKP